MHVRKVAAAFAALALLVTGCSSPAESAGSDGDNSPSVTSGFPRTIEHSSGTTTIEAAPERVVVLDMAALDTIDALGAGELVVGTVTDSVPTWLSDEEGIDYTSVESVGTLKEPDVEAIAKLDPDLVILGARSATFYEDFSKVFPTIDTTHSWEDADYSASVPASIELVGEAVGYDDEGARLASDLEDLMAEYGDTAAGKGSALVVMTNAGEISLHGAGSRWAPIYDVFGFDEAYQRDDADEGHQGEKVSFETVKEINPDWLFVVDRDAAVGQAQAGDTASQVLDNELIHTTNAWKNDQVVYLSPERWYIVMTGASNFPQMLNEIAVAID